MTVLKQNPLKGTSTSFRVHPLKIHKKTLRKKASKDKEGPVKCLYLYSQEMKPWKSLILWIEQDYKNQLHTNCYSYNYQQ